MYQARAGTAFFRGFMALLSLSLGGCLGTVGDSPVTEDTEENVGAGTGIDESDGDSSTDEADDDSGNDGKDASDDGSDSETDDGETDDGETPAEESPPAEEAPEQASLARGQEAYTTHCASCHGADGQGGGVGIRVKASESVEDLAGEIDGFMPLGNPAACSGDCPTDVARYIIGTFD